MHLVTLLPILTLTVYIQWNHQIAGTEAAVMSMKKDMRENGRKAEEEGIKTENIESVARGKVKA